MSLLQPVAKMFELELYSGDVLQAVEAVQPTQPPHPLITIATPNPEQITQSKQDLQFLRSLQQFDLLLPDGVGLVLASQLLALSPDEQRITGRITGTDFVEKLLHRAAVREQVVLVVGGREYGDAQSSRLAALTQAHYPELKQVQSRFFWTAGYQDISAPTQAEEHSLTELLSTLQPDLVFVALGAPYQEAWVIGHRTLLADSEVQTVMVVGGAFDFLLGKVQRAPEIVQAVGLEWLYRLVQEPWRWRRQLRLLTFTRLIIREFLSPKL